MDTSRLVGNLGREISRGGFSIIVDIFVTVLYDVAVYVSSETFDFTEFPDFSKTHELTFLIEAEQLDAVFPDAFIRKQGASGNLLFEAGDGYIEVCRIVTFFCFVCFGRRSDIVGYIVGTACQHCC